MKFPLHFPVALLALAAALFLSGCRQKSNDLVVGMEMAYPPFEMTDAQGQPRGVSVDMAGALGEFLHRPVRLVNMAFDGLIPALKTGQIDLIISSLTATPERAQSIDFSDPYLTTGLAILLPKNSPVQTVADLTPAGKIIAVKKGTTGHRYAAASLPDARLLVLDQASAAVLEVAQGKADAFIYDQISIYRNWQQHTDTTRALLAPFRTETWAIGLRQGNTALREQVNAFLRDFRAHGGFEKLGDQYLAEQKAAFRRLGLAFYF